MSLEARLARSLERGREGRVTSAASALWGRIASRRIARPLSFPREASVIAVGGSTLGGSGKTPVAVACARWLGEQGIRVALVGHGYRAAPGSARVVLADDLVDEVGDEALDAARALAGLPVSVVVAKARQQALDHGLALADVVVLDGVALCTPHRAMLSLLAVDARRPWGAGWCPPRGDLRTPKEVLLAACDRLVVVGEGLLPTSARPVDRVRVNSNGVMCAGLRLRWDDVRPLRVGLCTAIARPDRVLDLLAHHDITPEAVVHLPDHVSARQVAAAAGRVVTARPPDLWLCTSKCVTRLPARLWGGPVASIDYRLALPRTLALALAGVCGDASPSHA